jgi:hypothetical protein
MLCKNQFDLPFSPALPALPLPEPLPATRTSTAMHMPLQPSPTNNKTGNLAAVTEAALGVQITKVTVPGVCGQTSKWPI